MRCRDVSRAIAAPNGAISEAKIEAHLAACPRCSGLAEAALRLDRLWEATRPAPPSSAAWDASWAQIEQSLAAPEPEIPISVPFRAPMSARTIAGRLPIRLAAGFALSAAAALLVFLNLPEPAAPTLVQAGAIEGDFEVPVGQTVLYHVDSDEIEVIQAQPPASSDELTYFDLGESGMDSVDFFALFNFCEAIPELMASAGDDRSSPFGPFSQ